MSQSKRVAVRYFTSCTKINASYLPILEHEMDKTISPNAVLRRSFSFQAAAVLQCLSYRDGPSLFVKNIILIDHFEPAPLSLNDFQKYELYDILIMLFSATLQRGFTQI